jgi:hypothetical protein
MRDEQKAGRLNACAILALAIIMLAANLLLILMAKRYFPLGWALGSGLFLVGIVGLAEPRIALALSPQAKAIGVPRWSRILAPALFIAGCAIALWLMH